MSGSSIRIFLVDGRPEGLRLVEKSNWTGLGVVCSRAQYPEVRSRDDLDRPGIYVLTGPDEADPSTTRVYVGESETVRSRLDAHLKEKEFWTQATVFTSKDANLNKAHIRHIEAKLINLALEADRVSVDNGNAPQTVPMSEADRADADGFLEDMLVLFPVLGIDAFESPEQQSIGEALLTLTGPDAQATGRDTPAGFVVQQGSIARATEVPSIHTYMSALRSKLKADGVLMLDGTGGGLRFTKDFAFPSPSTAAGVVLGRSANGRTEWKDAAGRSLRDLDNAAIDESSEAGAT